MTFQSMAELRLYVAKQARDLASLESYDREQARIARERARARSNENLKLGRMRSSQQRKHLADGFD